ncbi:MAG: hypothetical protein QOE82_2905, partial [Thermoanaerobaculia bacterium]|nr:hypothetical protein [Thermoanaerobaculia bacterium]
LIRDKAEEPFDSNCEHGDSLY